MSRDPRLIERLWRNPSLKLLHGAGQHLVMSWLREVCLGDGVEDVLEARMISQSSDLFQVTKKPRSEF